MTKKQQLCIYKAEQLLIVHWKMLQALDNSMDFVLNGQVLAKPFLAVQMTDPLDMMIILDARVYKTNARKNTLLIQERETGKVIAQCQQNSITLLSKKIIQSYEPAIQARLYTRLMTHTQEKFKDFPQAKIHALAVRYASTEVQFYQIDQEVYFLRLPLVIKAAQTLLPLNFSVVTEQGMRHQQKTLSLYLDNALHLFIKAEDLAKQAYALLSYSALATIPISLANVEKLTRQDLVTRLAEHSSAANTLQSFILPNIKSANVANVVATMPSSIATPLDLSAKVIGVKQQKIIGWAKNNAQLSESIKIDIYENEQKLGSVNADKSCLDVGLTQDFGLCAFAIGLADDLLQGSPRQLDLRFAANGEALPGSPIKLGEGRFDFKLTVEQGETVKITFQQRTLSNAKFSLQLLLDGQLFNDTHMQGGSAFELKERLPDLAFDGQSHLLQLNINNAAGKLVSSTLRKVQHQYQGALENFDYRLLSGWLANKTFPDLIPVIDIWLNETLVKKGLVCHLSRLELCQKHQLNSDKVGFEWAIPDEFLFAPTLKVALYYTGTETLVIPVQTIVTAKDTMIRSLISAAEFLKSAPSDQDHQNRVDANTWARQQIIEPAIKALRQQSGIPQQIQLKLSNKLSQPKVKKSPIIDVIIPVYQGYDETLQCLESVLQAKNNTQLQVHVLNDCSPDGRLKYKLQALAQEREFNLIENSENLGFVATVNKGMRLHPDRDVLLLNSDTVVSDYWLDRICAAAAKNKNIATVTPFSNNATICSFPQFNQDNRFPEHQDLGQLNNLFYQYNEGVSVDLPTAVGFCMWIKREALLEIGYFDEQKWLHGYCEENDFCLRAANRGWRHVLACDVFVQHHGSVSFAGTKSARITRNLALLDQLYPDYSITVQRFLQQDPIALARNKVIKALLKQQAKHYLLFIMHSLGGGAKAHGDHLAHLLETQNQHVLELSVINNDAWQLQSVSSGYCMIYQYPDNYGQLLEDLSELGITRMHFHQVMGFPQKIWELPKQLKVAYDFTAHDFMPICPRISLIDETGRYCNQSQFDVNKCQRCVRLNGVNSTDVEQHLMAFDGSVKKWREHYTNVLSKAEQIICPSNSTAQIYQQHFALSNIQVKPHPEDSFKITPPVLANSEKISVAVIGAIGDHKGYQLLLDCAKNALKEDLPLRFVVIGYTRDDQQLSKLENVMITGAYQNADQLAAFIQLHNCKLAAFLSVWPETYCYTLTEALRNHLYPVSLNYGAVAERLTALNYGQVIDEYLTPVEINQALLSAGQAISKKTTTINYPGAVYHDLLKDYYEL
ncbi:MAG: glycosyltransferase [Methylococcaceae bacterium]|nr:glycosyltransferase [Methylococcaceae bacterium]